MTIADSGAAAESRRSFPSEPAGYLLGRFGLLVMLASFILAAWFGQTAIAIVLGLLVAAAGLARLWSRFSLKGVSCQRTLSLQRLFPGEQVELKLRLVNRKLLPLPWVQVDDQVPLGFSPAVHTGLETRAGFGSLSRSAALMWYSAVTWRHRLDCRRRGYYKIGPLKVTSGDIFGFYPRSMSEPLTDFLIVYPRIIPFAGLGIPSIYPAGEARAERQIFEDASRTIGIRDYQPQDSLRRIHWKASARQQKLQSRLYEPTTTLKAAIFLAADSFSHSSPADEEQFELGISVAASLASHLAEQDSPVGLYVNTRQADSGEPVAIPPGSGWGNLMAVLEALAKTTSRASGPFDDFLQSQRSRLPWGPTVIFILAQPPNSLENQLAALRESGYKLLVIQIGDAPGGSDGAVWHRIRGVEETGSLAVSEAP